MNRFSDAGSIPATSTITNADELLLKIRWYKGVFAIKIRIPGRD